MPVIPFEHLPQTARLWAFPASRPLDDVELSRVLEVVDGFLEGWRAHGVPLTAGREVRYGQFLFVGVDEAAAGVSGCSIDALVRCLGGLERELGVRLTDHGPVFYRAGTSIQQVPRLEFSRLATAGRVDRETVVFDNTIQTVAALRAGDWERVAGESWHRALLVDSAPTAPARRE